jgi:hypothetical protein
VLGWGWHVSLPADALDAPFKFQIYGDYTFCYLRVRLFFLLPAMTGSVLAMTYVLLVYVRHSTSFLVVDDALMLRSLLCPLCHSTSFQLPPPERQSMGVLPFTMEDTRRRHDRRWLLVLRHSQHGQIHSSNHDR